MNQSLQHLISTITQMQRDQDADPKDEDVLKVSDTVSVAASAYEVLRNTLEYDDEHLLRRNAIRRILKRRLGEADSKKLAEKLLRELIWAKYLPNKRVPTSQIGVVTTILEKYKRMFSALEEDTRVGQDHYEWLLDVLSTEVEYQVAPPCIDESLASFAYQSLKDRVRFETKMVKEEDRELQLYIAVHRAVVKSNRATLRYRLLTLYYPHWRSADASDPVVHEVSSHLSTVIRSVDGQIDHPSAEAVFRFIRRHTIVFHLISDIAQDNPEAFSAAVASGDMGKIDTALTSAANERYGIFRSRLTRTVIRAAFFLLFTKSILAFLVEYPYEVFVIQSTDYFPLMVNILFPPVLLASVGLTVRIPKKKNTENILEEAHVYLGYGEEMAFLFKQKRPWGRGPLYVVFNLIYVALFSVTVFFIASALKSFEFNNLSIFFFLFFLSLVAYFGLRIRNTRREYLLIDTSTGFFGMLGSMIFLPIVRVGRWISIRAPKVNIFLFFFDFIVEAPFKATIDMVESWVAFLREKREEI